LPTQKEKRPLPPQGTREVKTSGDRNANRERPVPKEAVK